MLVYKQRYKPRTSRAFTKSDLTVYDSAGNTALNALTVYGKSEVVDGSIKSAGEGYAVVRLADLTWTKGTGFNPGIQIYYTTISGKKQSTQTQCLCNKYKFYGNTFSGMPNNSIAANSGYPYVYVRDDNYTTVEDLVAYLGDATLCYELADPTQGNAIAVKTDNGTGIDGTMAVFETGTPLYGIDENTRDVMMWDGSAGTITKNCGELDLGTLNWNYSTEYVSFSTQITDMATGTYYIAGNILCANYQTKSQAVLDVESIGIAIANNANVVIIKDPAYTDTTTFKTAMNGVKLVYELATPTTQSLTSTENDSIAGLRTFTPQTHAQNNAETDMTVNYTIRVPTI